MQPHKNKIINRAVHTMPLCSGDDATRALAVAGCGSRTALFAITRIETEAGLAAALALESNTLGRSAIVQALKKRIEEMTLKESQKQAQGE